MKRLILLGLLTSILKSYAFDLNAAYQHALDYNADYLTAVAQNQAGQEQQAQGLAALLPNFSAQADYTENYLNSNMVVYYHQPTLSAQFQQVIFDLGKFSQYTKSKFATQIAKLQLADAKQNLMLKVAQAYFDLLYANDTRAAIRYTRIALAKQLNQAKTAFNVGTVTIADVNDAKAAFDSASAQELQADNELINQKTLFHNLTGLNADLIQPLAKNIVLIAPVPSKIEQWVQMAKVHNNTLKIATTQLAMALADISIAKANHMPTVNLSGRLQYQGNAMVDGVDSAATQAIINQSLTIPGTFLSGYTQAAVGLQVTIPLYAGGGINSQVRQAVNSYEAANQQLMVASRQTDQELQDAFWQVQNGVELVKAQTQALKSAKVKLNSDQVGYQVGSRNLIDVINAEKNYLQAMQTYHQARYNYLISNLKLKYLAGKLDNEALKMINLNIQQ